VTRLSPLALIIALAVATPGALAEEPPPLVVADDFQRGSDRWQTTDPDPAKLSWEIVDLKNAEGKPTQAFRVTGKSTYEPKYRSPPNFALLKDVIVGDFELTASVQSTNVNAGPHRDMCIIFGYQDPTHFYYVHFGAKADPNACQIFVVDEAARTPITKLEAKGTPWTEGWHWVRVRRDIKSGAIEVFFDDMKKPFMAADDRRFTWGQVGLGTFDDNGHWDDFELRGEKLPGKGAAEGKRESR